MSAVRIRLRVEVRRRGRELLGALLVVLALGSTTHLLFTGVRARRRELAVLKAIGLTRRQALASVLVQATTLVCAALVVAVPCGLLAGRVAWGAMARWLGVAEDLAAWTPAAALVIGGSVAVANLIAFVRARAAARVRPAVALRSE